MTAAEMSVIAWIAVETLLLRIDIDLPDQTRVHQRVECIVNRSAGKRGVTGGQGGKNHIGCRMNGVQKQIVIDGHALLGGPDPALLQYIGNPAWDS